MASTSIGWKFHRIWSSEWFHNKEAAAEKVLAAYRRALNGEEAEDLVESVLTDGPEAARPSTDPGAHARRRGPRPNVPAGWKIDEYWDHQLIELTQWIESDDLLRTEDELIAEVMDELGFQRRGARIVAAIRSAIRRARQAKR